MKRDHWRRHNDELDPDTDYRQIYGVLAQHEFPWDMLMALSFALFRTYAVPGIGRLLDETGAFTTDTQKRYDDTTLLLAAPGEQGFEHPDARAAIRRINQMHRAYDIPDHEMRYVLSTFVVVPARWIERFGKRPLTDREVRASVRYYTELGRHMGIRHIPEDYDAFARLMDDYEKEHFAYAAGSRRVADATLDLMTTFYPWVPDRLMHAFARSLMDEPLRSSLRYATPPRLVERLGPLSLRLRGMLLRAAPARRRPKQLEDIRWIRSYPDGYDISSLGTFPGGCPAPHGDHGAARS
ncbi:oxygenase MpaB family protein [Aeromicrobium piscarium]|uniref:DUF2236 domain-containing protein n=1 Tax=Aeromicrobium piscarium TaxID=2590901 RepID=A0A554SPD7_9ACTN|nr:oxygenase MpaB family protein [Aeromicrobium piscarium]TSD68223.1 DUF2236 domain-containing protein [Aeromicrobium piscarium]